MKSKKMLVGSISVILICAFALGAHFYKKGQSDSTNTPVVENAEIFKRTYSPVFGDENAKVLLTEFLDPECEACRAFYPIVKNLLKEFQGQLKLAVRYAPFHPNAMLIIKVLEAARKQNRYTETLEILFHYQPSWGSHHNPKPELIWDFLPKVGLDIPRLKKDMEDPGILKIIEQDMADLKVLGIRQTPSFFVNGKPLVQFGVNQLRTLIQEEIQKAYP